jgi:hypothetical protein
MPVGYTPLAVPAATPPVYRDMSPPQPWPLAGPRADQPDLDAQVEYQRAQEEYRLRLALIETQAKLQKLQRAKSANIRISEKGAVSVYGLGKYPVTLYADQWRMLLAQAELIEQFIQENEAELASRQG